MQNCRPPTTKDTAAHISKQRRSFTRMAFWVLVTPVPAYRNLAGFAEGWDLEGARLSPGLLCTAWKALSVCLYALPLRVCWM